MMTSDSDESDYEDARQHHDNIVDPDLPAPVAVASSSNSGNLVQPEPERENANANANVNEENIIRPQLQPQVPAPVQQQQVIQFPVDPPPAYGAGGVEVPPPGVDIFPGNDDGPRPIPGDPQRNQELFMRLMVEYAIRDGHGPPMAVDSDSDEDVYGLYSDEDDTEFPLLNRGERDRAGGSDGYDAQDAADLDEDVPEFDQELPVQHSYLGDGMEELQGRIVLEEDATPEIPLIAMGQHLIPGQTLPLQVYHAVFQNAIRRCVMGDRLFGIVHNDMNSPSGNVIYIGALGTLAEVFEFQEEVDGEGEGGGSATFAVKAKGRQRFNVVEVRRQADGNLMGKVRIRPEIRLQSFILTVLSPPTSRNFLPPPNELLGSEEETGGGGTNTNVMASTSSGGPPDSPMPLRGISRFSLERRSSLVSVASTTTNAAAIEQDLKTLKGKIESQRKRLKYYSALTPHPYFVYEHYDETVLVERVHRLLTTELLGLAKSKGKIPMDASDLSFWLAQNLLIDDSHRSKVLKMDCPIQRLRYYLELLGKTTKVITCKNCETHIADLSQIFSMSIEGPQGTYVNPHGFVHETLTVFKTRDLITRGGPSTEASWFPGYSWTIVECRRCKCHIGWKFQAVGRLKPARFWGLARRSVITKYNFDSDLNDSTASAVSMRTPPNSANSEGYSTVALF